MNMNMKTATREDLNDIVGGGGMFTKEVIIGHEVLLAAGYTVTIGKTFNFLIGTTSATKLALLKARYTLYEIICCTHIPIELMSGLEHLPVERVMDDLRLLVGVFLNKPLLKHFVAAPEFVKYGSEGYAKYSQQYNSWYIEFIELGGGFGIVTELPDKRAIKKVITMVQTIMRNKKYIYGDKIYLPKVVTKLRPATVVSVCLEHIRDGGSPAHEWVLAEMGLVPCLVRKATEIHNGENCRALLAVFDTVKELTAAHKKTMRRADAYLLIKAGACKLKHPINDKKPLVPESEIQGYML